MCTLANVMFWATMVIFSRVRTPDGESSSLTMGDAEKALMIWIPITIVVQMIFYFASWRDYQRALNPQQ